MGSAKDARRWCSASARACSSAIASVGPEVPGALDVAPACVIELAAFLAVDEEHEAILVDALKACPPAPPFHSTRTTPLRSRSLGLEEALDLPLRANFAEFGVVAILE